MFLTKKNQSPKNCFRFGHFHKTVSENYFITKYMYYSTVIPWNIKIIVKPVINLTFALIMTVIVKYEEVVIILFVNL